MICQECKVDRKEEDFLQKDKCFRCQYKEKVKPIPNRTLICKTCKKEFEKKSRWVHCSWECQQKAEAEQKKYHWTHNLS